MCSLTTIIIVEADMWLVGYNGVTGEYSCEPLTEWLEEALGGLWTVPNDAWFII